MLENAKRRESRGWLAGSRLAHWQKLSTPKSGSALFQGGSVSPSQAKPGCVSTGLLFIRAIAERVCAKASDEQGEPTHWLKHGGVYGRPCGRAVVTVLKEKKLRTRARLGTRKTAERPCMISHSQLGAGLRAVGAVSREMRREYCARRRTPARQTEQAKEKEDAGANDETSSS